jgi:hypothetical protein
MLENLLELCFVTTGGVSGRRTTAGQRNAAATVLGGRNRSRWRKDIGLGWRSSC